MAMATTFAHLDRRVALVFAVVFGLAALGIAGSALVAVYTGLGNTPLLRVPLANLVTPVLGEGNGEILEAAYAIGDVKPATLT